MSEINTGGPAFPTENEGQSGPSTWRYEGMTLRDYFAGQAMEGYNKCIRDYGWGEDILLEHAKQAYAIADAMLKARAL